MQGVRGFDELTARLRSLRARSGLSYRDLHQRVVRSRKRRGVAELPAYNTVYRCLRPGRSRLDVELVVDIARVLLGDDAALEWRRAYEVVAGTATDASVVSTTNTLPDDTAEFTGRTAELDRLLEIAARSDGAVAAAIEGMAGVGKTKLAIRAAHVLRAQGRFGDIQLWVNLRGYDPDRSPVDPAAVLDSFLRHLGVPGSRIQGWSLAQRAAKFDELLSLSGKQALIGLDNAADEDQVRPLLPSSPSCLVLITSRRRLEDLPVAHVPLDAFTREDSVEFLRRMVGAARIDADPESALGIADLVGQLPLALAVVAGRIVASPDWTLADQMSRSTDHRARLRLEAGVELALTLSYDQLPTEQRRCCGCWPRIQDVTWTPTPPPLWRTPTWTRPNICWPPRPPRIWSSRAAVDVTSCTTSYASSPPAGHMTRTPVGSGEPRSPACSTTIAIPRFAPCGTIRRTKQIAGHRSTIPARRPWTFRIGPRPSNGWTSSALT